MAGIGGISGSGPLTGSPSGLALSGIGDAQARVARAAEALAGGGEAAAVLPQAAADLALAQVQAGVAAAVLRSDDRTTGMLIDLLA
ncbi:hypothetical protein [Rhodospirillum centenum]|uniref:Uncharacterized protein n=1 Tax=Rhodospirillum centenum (strain ATCC 51521 / SW) TaxID=414684 RepID=B6ITK7_RHOCS|nr:hypothetical protein [Rhodospirillum centenum]ACI99308.1 hypothetical protein RC1_1912 [Rhodospirillum centenum SW]